ncbi:TolC family outer membrane protein [Pseudogemmobacter sp. W21_MBD1_M6]|uniref:TolC family outer membrane protein n=1 Tax=Pseudogemmobacter sp. W21_MBD1_M6 TaxID=3240271 RepID=UPI003F9B077F
MEISLKKYLGVAAAAALLLTAPLARAETLTDALIGAYNNSGLLEQNRALLRVADEDVAIAMSALRPIISYSVGAGYRTPTQTDDWSSTAALSAELTIYDAGASRLAIDAAKETVLGTREQLVSVEQNVLLRAVNAYMSVRRDTEIVDLRQNNVRVITQALRAARDRFEVGEVTRTDVAIAESSLAAARSGLSSAQGALAQSRAEYRAAVGRAPGQLASPPARPNTAKSLDAATAAAVRMHPDILAAQRQVTVSELNILRARTAMQPKGTIGASVSVDDNRDTTKSLQLTLSGPIYQGGRLSALTRQAMARRDSTRAALLLTSVNVAQNVANAWAGLDVSRSVLSASNEQVSSARLAYRGVSEEATLGARTTLDVLNAEQDVLDAEGSRISAITDQYVATYQLLASMGLLTVNHLGLGIKTYDPAAYYNLVKNAPAISMQGAQLDRVLRGLGKK